MPVRQGWSKGINNKAHWRDMPEGTVRDSVNMDPLNSGSYALRSSYEQVYAGGEIRGGVAVGDIILMADGEDLVHFDTRTGVATALRTIAGSGWFTGDVLNSELFFCTANETLRFKDGVLRRWGVQDVLNQPVPTLTSGALQPGTYQLAMTWFDGVDEGGTSGAIQIDVVEGQGLAVDLPALEGHTPRLYVSAVNGSTLYLQAEGAGRHLVARVDDSAPRLETMYMRAPNPGAHITQHNGVLAVAAGKHLWITHPMRPHLYRPMRDFFQFSADIGFVLSADGGIYVSADKTYFISGVEGDEPTSQVVLPYPSVAGSAVGLPDGRAAWMTRYGVATSTGPGQVELISQDNFVPELADTGSSGIVERNGNQMVVTTMSGGRGPNPLAASDYYEAEIVTP